MRIPATIATHGAVTLLLALLLVGGCGQKRYGDGEIRPVSAARVGTVLDVSDVMVEEDPSLIGPGLGLVAGGFLGSAFGKGTGRMLFTVGGALLGADVGGQGSLDYHKRRYRAVQLTMQMDNGGVLVVVQGDNEYFVRGDRVRVVGMGEDRVSVQHI
ncbi:MAG: hypothetical protein LBH65_04745 [Desulfovibrio sp.]|jgi:outer membrane lipoprotein SlyB|nr:hypothetical protein [Desulfovibrio sp.]